MSGARWTVYGDGRYMLHGLRNVSVLSGHGSDAWTAVEDAGGDWYGFVETDGSLFGVLSKSLSVLGMCFAGGVAYEEERGAGRVVRLVVYKGGA